MSEKEELTAKNVVKDDDEVEKNLEEAGVVQALDGGYGWVVVLASFLTNVVVDGVIFTIGDILLPIWVEEFRCSNASAALAMSILSGSYLLVGPLASALTNMFGCRRVVIAGALLSSLGFITSAIAPEIYFLYISFGLIGGTGFGLMYLPSIVIISQYFSIKRSMATGIAVAGSGIGTTFFSLTNPIVMSTLGTNWRFFLVYVAIVSFIVIFFSFAFKPVKPSEEQIDKVTKIVEDYEKTKQNGSLTSGTLGASLPHLNSTRPFLSTVELNNKNLTVPNGFSQRNLHDVAKDSVRDINRPLSKMDVFYGGSSTSLAVRSRSNTMTKLSRPDLKSAASRETLQSNALLSKIDLPSEDDGGEISTGWKQTLKSTFRGLLDPSLLYSPSFIILSLSGMLTLSCFYVPYNYLGDHINKLPNVSPTMKALPISLLGIINIGARIICGWIADQPQVDALMVTNIAVIAAGVATVTVPFFGQYWQFIAYCLPFATGAACFAALRSVIIVDLYGLAKLTNAFGILLTFMGIGATFGSPLTAYVKDVTGNFDVSFYIMGTLMALSGVICIPLRSLREWEIRRSNPADAVSTVELDKLQA